MNLCTVIGHPNSGTTWLCHILAEAIDGITSVGRGRIGVANTWKIERTHSGPNHVKRVVLDGKLVLTKRNPFDVLVSYHRKHSTLNIDDVAVGLCAEWQALLDRWRAYDVIETSYENLVENGIVEVQFLALRAFNIVLSEADAKRCLLSCTPNRKPRPVGAWRQELDERYITLLASMIDLNREGYNINLENRID